MFQFNSVFILRYLYCTHTHINNELHFFRSLVCSFLPFNFIIVRWSWFLSVSKKRRTFWICRHRNQTILAMRACAPRNIPRRCANTHRNARTNIFYEDLRIKSILYIWKFMAVIFFLAACPPFALWAIDDNNIKNTHIHASTHACMHALHGQQ